MKRSEKLLGLVLLVSVGAFVVVPWIWQAFRGPVAQQETALRLATEKLDKAKGQFDIALANVKSMAQFKEQSLSSNAAQGALAYQQWLTDLAEIVAEFKAPEVTPERISPSRDNSYVAVRLRVTGEGTIEQLRTFLYRFHRANVLHRITSMVAEAQDNSSRPRLTIRITTEAIALRDAPEKGPTLFPRSAIASVSDGDGPTKIELTSVEGFPDAAPFELRIGQNYYSVADIDGKELLLELEEGQEVEAAEEDIVELSVVHADFKDVVITEYDTLIKKNPFAKPAPYRPRLDLIGSKSVGRGGKLSLSAKVTGADPSDKKVAFEVLSELTDGMTFEAGTLNWEPPAELAAGDFTVKVRAAGGGLREPIEDEFKLSLTDVNKPPVITLPENLVATLGQAITTTLAATDPETPVEELKFALADGAPAGATFNAETRELTFTPPATGEPGEVTINVTVTDAGTPAQTATGSIKVTVQDDKAQFTFMEGVVAADSVPEAWLRDKSTNTRMVLHEGDDLKYAGFNAVVLSIGNDFLLMQQANETIRLDVGKNLRESIVIAKLDPPKESPAADTEVKTDDATIPAAPPKPEEASSATSSEPTDTAASEKSESTAVPTPAPTEATGKPEVTPATGLNAGAGVSTEATPMPAETTATSEVRETAAPAEPSSSEPSSSEPAPAEDAPATSDAESEEEAPTAAN
tara:strand:- start:84844 stop:86922 length:2079 start_codon:yes stop_codon:yes gene_type:complete